jgi:hypothetical protein
MHLGGMGQLLDAQAKYTGLSADQLSEQHIRAAQFTIEESLHIPFFLTRYCSDQLALWASFVNVPGTPNLGSPPPRPTPTGILPVTALPAAPETLTDGFFQPPMSQALYLYVTAGQPAGSVNGTVAISGTDGNGLPATELIIPGTRQQILTATTWSSLTSIGLPAQTQAGDSVSVGTTKGLILGSDYDRIQKPLSYFIRDWMALTGRTSLDWTPLWEKNGLTGFRFALAGNVVGPDIPPVWQNIDRKFGIVHIIPTAAASVTFALSAINPLYSVGQRSGMVPDFIHVRYTAGLVNPKTWDCSQPLPPFDTEWDQGLVMEFQRNIGQMAAANTLREMGSYLDQGGVSLSIDGMSQSVVPNLVYQRADTLEMGVRTWIERTMQKEKPMEVICI